MLFLGATGTVTTIAALTDIAAVSAHIQTLEAEIERLGAEIKAVPDKQLEESRSAWEAATLAADAAGTLAWTVVRPLAVASVAGTPFTIEEEDSSMIPGGENPVNDTYVVTIPATAERITAVRIEVIQDSRFPGDEVARAGSAFFLSEIEVAGSVDEASATMPIRLASSRTVPRA